MPFGFFAHSPEPGGNVESGPRVPAWIFRFGELPLKKGHSGKLFKITTARSRHQKFTHPNLNPGRRLASLRSGIIAEKEKLDRTHRKALSKSPFPSVRLHPSMMGLSNRRHFHPRVGLGRRAWNRLEGFESQFRRRRFHRSHFRFVFCLQTRDTRNTGQGL